MTKAEMEICHNSYGSFIQDPLIFLLPSMMCQKDRKSKFRFFWTTRRKQVNAEEMIYINYNKVNKS